VHVHSQNSEHSIHNDTLVGTPIQLTRSSHPYPPLQYCRQQLPVLGTHVQSLPQRTTMHGTGRRQSCYLAEPLHTVAPCAITLKLNHSLTEKGCPTLQPY